MYLHMILISHSPLQRSIKSADVGTVPRLSPDVCEGIMYIEKYSLYSFSRKAPALDRVCSYNKI